jgi:hypothetical protein
MATFVTTDELGDFLGEDLVDARFIQAGMFLELATAQIQGWTRQRIEAVVDDAIILPGTFDWELELPERPVTAAIVTAIDGVAPIDGTYRLSGSKLFRPGGWAGPWGLQSGNAPSGWGRAWWWDIPTTVEVTYSHGYPIIPDDIRMVCLQLAARMLQNPTGLAQESIGTYSVMYEARNAVGTAAGGLTGAETVLLSRYRRRAMAVRTPQR